MKKTELKQLIKEVIIEEMAFSTPNEMISWIGDKITPAHWTVMYKWIQDGKLKYNDFNEVLKHYEII